MTRTSDQDENLERLERIKQLWVELQSAKENGPVYRDLIKRIRLESDAFRRTLEAHDTDS